MPVDPPPGDAAPRVASTPDPAVTPAPPLTETPLSDVGTSAREADDRLGTAVAVGLALVGLLGALIAWRVVSIADDSSLATRDALAAARERSAATLAAESRTSDAHAAWLQYEVNRRVAAGLRTEGHHDEALRHDKAAAAHYGFSEPQYVGADGEYQVDEHRAGIVARFGSGVDIEPAPHLEAAEAGEGRGLSLTLIGILVAAALPFLTVAEVAGPGRLRLTTAALGFGLLAAGFVAVAASWA